MLSVPEKAGALLQKRAVTHAITALEQILPAWDFDSLLQI